MLSHTCFFGALLIYYIPRMMNKKSKFLRNTHNVLGSLAILGMLGETIMKFGTPSFMKYLGFSAVMLFIGITGYLMTKAKNMRRWHIIATLSFFAYLALIIIL